MSGATDPFPRVSSCAHMHKFDNSALIIHHMHEVLRTLRVYFFLCTRNYLENAARIIL